MKSIKKTIVKKYDCFFAAFFAYNNRNIIEKELNRMKETRTIEFKENVTNTFLKTVSAFSNYRWRYDIFGVDEYGAKGIIMVEGRGRGTKYIIR